MVTGAVNQQSHMDIRVPSDFIPEPKPSRELWGQLGSIDPLHGARVVAVPRDVLFRKDAFKILEFGL